MARLNFCGGTYQSLSPNIDAEFCMNLYPEAVESLVGRSAMALIPADGLAVFAQLPAGSVQAVPGLFTYNGRTFTTGVIQASQVIHLYEVMGQNVPLIDRGPLGAPVSNAPAIWAANPNQLVFTVAGTGLIYTLTLATNVLTSIAPNGENAISVKYLQGFFVALIQNSNTIMVSNLEDGTTWPAINIANISDFPDNIVAMESTELTIWFLGRKASVPYYNSGALFPLAPIPGAYAEDGCAAPFGVSKLDNTIFFIGGNDDQGNGIAWRMSGYTPQRISTHAVETAWQAYPTLADAISYSYQSRGHKFWAIYFPTANATWVYDIATQLWHQRGTWNPATGMFGAHKSMCHTFAFGQHLVGDPFSGNIYSMSVANLTDNGTNIRRVRRAPYIAKEHSWIFHRSFELLAEMGLPSQIAAPSDAPIQLFLADPTGQVWVLQISDAGILLPASYAPAGQIASAPILADNVNQSTFWQLAITAGGAVYGLPSARGRSDVANFAMATNQSFLDTSLQVSPLGAVSVSAPKAHLRAPLLMMRWSDDGAHTWTDYFPMSLGLTGEFNRRAIWRRLGKSRNRVYEVAFADPVSLRIVDAFVDADPQFKPQERLVSQLGKMA